MPRTPQTWGSPAALWVTVAGWIGAERDRERLTQVTAGADQAFHYSPLKLREYLAMALPAVAADVGEIGRVLEDGHSGLLYQPGDAAGLASGLRRLAEDDELRARIGDAGRQRVLESWTWDEITQRCLERLPR